jgi:hypothetical protein
MLGGAMLGGGLCKNSHEFFGHSELVSESNTACHSELVSESNTACHSELDSESQAAGKEIAGQARNDSLQDAGQARNDSLQDAGQARNDVPVCSLARSLAGGALRVSLAAVLTFALCALTFLAQIPAPALADVRDIPAEVATELAEVAGTNEQARLAFGGTPERPEIVWVFEGRALDALTVASYGSVNLGVRLSLEDLGASNAGQVDDGERVQVAGAAQTQVYGRQDAAPTEAGQSQVATTDMLASDIATQASVVMNFEASGMLPAPATVSLIVPDFLVGAALSLYALDASSGTYNLMQSGLRAADGYVGFMLSELSPLVLSVGLPQALPAAFAGQAQGGGQVQVEGAAQAQTDGRMISAPTGVAQAQTDGRMISAPTGVAQAQAYGIAGGDVTGASPFFSTTLFVVLGIFAVAIAVVALLLNKRHKMRIDRKSVV